MHQFPVTVYYDETDLGAIVYHANYMKFIDRARADWVRGIGVDQNALREQGFVFVVHRIEADFLASAKLEDQLMIRTNVMEVTRLRLILDQRVYRDRTCLFRARVTIALVSLDGKPRRLPEQLTALGDLGALMVM
ncbi:tol-pal system-associated acyl-CoA thioesterase [Pararhodobacter sp. CCB-MM2]|uniref:tol-pal system-associated acyl-CoA thioesterase n=1 Tax=Pararhodobacter sp. CCB-MM2 TaxID=1786003 RepID=UPI00083746CF|nr:tol-pal system-associated acyl-CoA thioesterase [Pararhodobacter sp. CCB-MM2]MCA2013096.1 tol-pal system-associated acyl-CoA thioesterase [Cereibacter sphaeroides]